MPAGPPFGLNSSSPCARLPQKPATVQSKTKRLLHDETASKAQATMEKDSRCSACGISFPSKPSISRSSLASPVWVSTGKSRWRGNKKLLPGIPPLMRLAMHWEVDDSGMAGRVPTDGKLRVRDATEDERCCRQQMDAGHEPPSIVLAAPHCHRFNQGRLTSLERAATIIQRYRFLSSYASYYQNAISTLLSMPPARASGQSMSSVPSLS